MKKIAILLTIICCIANSYSQNSIEHYKMGNQYYESKDYPSAIKQYESLIAEGYENAELFYNLGNAYYRVNQIEHAILNYERALRLSPRDHEIKDNLALANSKTIDKINSIPQLFVVKIWNAIRGSFSTKGWSVIAIILFVLFCLAIIWFYLSYQYATRKISLILSIVLFVLFGLSTLMMVASTHNKKEAIVMQTMTTIKSSPEKGSVDKLILHAGTKIEIEDQIQEWYKVRIADGNKGWIEAHAVEVI